MYSDNVLILMLMVFSKLFSGDFSDTDVVSTVIPSYPKLCSDICCHSEVDGATFPLYPSCAQIIFLTVVDVTMTLSSLYNTVQLACSPRART